MIDGDITDCFVQKLAFVETNDYTCTGMGLNGLVSLYYQLYRSELKLVDTN